MNSSEFYIWSETEPDSYELVDGVAIRMPDAKQGGRRMGNLFRAAELSLGPAHFLLWARAPLAELGGKAPYLYAAESWSHLAAVLQILRDPERRRKLRGDSFGDIRARAARLSVIERERQSSTPSGPSA